MIKQCTGGLILKDIFLPGVPLNFSFWIYVAMDFLNKQATRNKRKITGGSSHYESANSGQQVDYLAICLSKNSHVLLKDSANCFRFLMCMCIKRRFIIGISNMHFRLMSKCYHQEELEGF